MEEETRQVLIEFKNEIVGEFRAFKNGITGEFQAFKAEVTEEVRRLSDKVESLDQRVENLDQKIDRVKEEVTEEMKRYVGIIYEDFQHRVSLLAEGHQMLNEKLDRIGEQNHLAHDEFRGSFARLEVRIYSLEQRNP